MAKAKAKATKLPTSLITFLLDRTGSMDSCKDATIEAFNAYVGGLKAEKDARIDFTFLQFDSVSLDKICVAAPIKDVALLDHSNYQPRASTPLIDASVNTINAVAESLSKRDDKPKVIVCIQTDGFENASTQHTWDELNALIKAKTAEGWQFNFMGAGLDAYSVGSKMGIGAAATMSYDPSKRHTTRAAFAATAHNHSGFSSGRLMASTYSGAQRFASGDQHASADLMQATNDPLDLTNATPASAGSGSVAKTVTKKPIVDKITL